jgi:hypothetical protein
VKLPSPERASQPRQQVKQLGIAMISAVKSIWAKGPAEEVHPGQGGGVIRPR